MKRVKTYKFEFELEKGDIVHIDGFPYEYLGDGVIGGNTYLPPKDEIYVQQAAMRRCKTPGCNTTFGPEAPGLPEYCPACQDKQRKKDCKCFGPCDCKPVEQHQNPMEALRELIEDMEKNEPTPPRTLTWRPPPAEQIFLDNTGGMVYGPGRIRIGDGCCNR